MKVTLPLCALVLFLSAVPAARAHAPSAFEIDYNPQTKILSVKVAHAVKNPEKHYIKEISVKRGGKLLMSQVMFRQDGPEKADFTFILENVKAGDEIEVTALCNIAGAKTQKYKISPPRP